MTAPPPLRLAVILTAASIVGTTPIRAHHSHGNYSDAFVDVEGVVKEVHLSLIHI